MTNLNSADVRFNLSAGDLGQTFDQLVGPSRISLTPSFMSSPFRRYLAAIATSVSVGLLGTLAGCDSRSPADAAKSLGPAETQRVTSLKDFADKFLKDCKGTTPSSAATLGTIQFFSKLPFEKINEVFQKFHKGTSLDDDIAAAMTYEAVFNPKINNPDEFLANVKWFKGKSGVEPYAALSLGLAAAKSGKTKEEVYDTYVLLSSGTKYDSYAAASMTLEIMEARPN